MAWYSVCNMIRIDLFCVLLCCADRDYNCTDWDIWKKEYQYYVNVNAAICREFEQVSASARAGSFVQDQHKLLMYCRKNEEVPKQTYLSTALTWFEQESSKQGSSLNDELNILMSNRDCSMEETFQDFARNAVRIWPTTQELFNNFKNNIDYVVRANTPDPSTRITETELSAEEGGDINMSLPVTEKSPVTSPSAPPNDPMCDNVPVQTAPRANSPAQEDITLVSTPVVLLNPESGSAQQESGSVEQESASVQQDFESVQQRGQSASPQSESVQQESGSGGEAGGNPDVHVPTTLVHGVARVQSSENTSSNSEVGRDACGLTYVKNTDTGLYDFSNSAVKISSVKCYNVAPVEADTPVQEPRNILNWEWNTQVKRYRWWEDMKTNDIMQEDGSYDKIVENQQMFLVGGEDSSVKYYFQKPCSELNAWGICDWEVKCCEGDETRIEKRFNLEFVQSVKPRKFT